MIIKREYVNFGYLMESDEEFRKVVLHALRDYPPDKREECIAYNTYSILHNADIGNGFTHFDEIKEAMEHLDQVKPFDNGLSLGDVNKVHFFNGSEDESDKRIDLVLSYVIDGIENIVQVVTLEDVDGRCAANSDMDDFPVWW